MKLLTRCYVMAIRYLNMYCTVYVYLGLHDNICVFVIYLLLCVRFREYELLQF